MPPRAYLAFTVRQAGGRGRDAGVRPRLRRDGVLRYQRVRAAPGSEIGVRGGDPEVHTAALAGKQPRIFGDGKQSRDFCHIDNVVEANFAAATADARRASGGVFNIGCGEAIDLNRVVALIGDILGLKLQAVYEPERAGDIKHSWGDVGAARAALGFHAAVSFSDGLRRTIEWYRANR